MFLSGYGPYGNTGAGLPGMSKAGCPSETRVWFYNEPSPALFKAA